jgi:hypothetical protein
VFSVLLVAVDFIEDDDSLSAGVEVVATTTAPIVTAIEASRIL